MKKSDLSAHFANKVSLSKVQASRCGRCCGLGDQ